ncbi:histone-lysine N-methyltransferase ASHR1-like [Argentina anserina]|uniref:histone-lysine N-methyltransferase ASHR1-like n=1 Tax=Argentina anserina TaxID=57926 RepID=UPI00217658CA|nr:histone-lysine N-methyltransferase ASHR1-like [Potentilla anserina]
MQFACNAHTICDSELKPLGTGLYPVISIINHSCLPNSVLLFEGRTSVVRAVQHIPKGAEGHYGDIQESAILEGYRCKDNKCDGFLLRDSGMELPMTRDSYVNNVDVLRAKKRLLRWNHLMKVEDWSEALAYCRLTIPVYQKTSLPFPVGVYPGFHPSLGLQYYTCGKLEWLLGETDDAVKSLTKAVDILRITHGTSTPFMKDLFRRLEEARAEAFISGV